MKRIASGRAHRHTAGLAARIVIATVLGAACLATATQAQDMGTGRRADSPVAQPVPDAGSATEFERLFWDCDYAATTRPIAPIDAMGCSVATELFQRTAFDGDFGALLAWWREHKAVEHAKRDAEWARREGAGGPMSGL